ncbi:MAG TPA: DUF1844 domain-containing protein [Thermoanaerobaculia bacterium]|nr:DUF1844 domain-containing protein [Thermoanaerobaculia bacterium]HXT50474.1 DUF1844 domain-containing protein [Thermoanaerobaculia bacterium]
MGKDLKVTDKRIFTPEGDLKDEFRHLKDQPPPVATAERAAEPAAATAASTAAPSPPAEPKKAPQGPRQAASDPRSAGRAAAPPPDPEPTPRLELPGTPPGYGAPTFYDLVAVLAEPVSLYLGDIPLPDGQSAENLEMARLHIDLLDVLRQKTAGNVSAQESAVLEDVLYRLRLRYVQKRG